MAADNGKSEEKHLLEEHRRRMVEQLENNPESLSDYDVLEILLSNAIPRKNTNEIAHAMLRAFGSFDEILHAAWKQLTEIKGISDSTAAYLQCIGLCMERIWQREMEAPSTFRYESFCDYLNRRFAGAKVERIELYKLDAREHIDYVKSYTTNEIDRAELAMDSLGHFLAMSHPRAILIVHNHVLGNSSPSKDDDRFTEKVQMLCAMQNVELYDHMIVSPIDIYSYLRSGRLDGIKRKFNIQAIFGFH